MKAFVLDKKLKFCCLERVNSLLNYKILDITKSKLFADNKLNVAKMTISLFDGVENTEGKGENAGYQRFSPFPTVFSEAVFFRVVKSRDCEVEIILLCPNILR